MSLSLEGKNALVTGGSRGIGRAIGERLAADGATVVINYARNEQLAQEVVKAVSAKGGKGMGIQADVSKPAEVRRLFGEAEKAIGPLDVVIANAGVYLSKPLIENTEADYDYVFDINTRGVFFTLQEAARRVHDGGRIIAISTGGTKMMFPNSALYLGSKAAVEQFARSLPRARSAQCDRERLVARLHRHGHAARAVPRIRREPVALQSRRHGEGSGRRRSLSRQRRRALGHGTECTSRRRRGLRLLRR